MTGTSSSPPVDKKAIRLSLTPSIAMEKQANVSVEETTMPEKDISQVQVSEVLDVVPRTRVQNFVQGFRKFFSVQGMQQSGAVLIKLAKFTGPGTLISVAYVDPDNFQTALDAGAQFKYKLLCIVLLGVFMAIYLQVWHGSINVKNRPLMLNFRHWPRNWVASRG